MAFERGNDTAESLNKLQLMDTKKWRPELKGSTETDPDKKALETRQNEMLYKAELEEAMKRARMYENNQYKAYALLWQRCAKAMQNRIEARKDYKKLIYNNPIELLKAIKEHALNYQETRYEMSIISDAMRACLSAKQRENEGLQDYTRRFKTSMEILESHIGGPLEIPKYVKTMDGYDEASPNKRMELAKQASEQLFTYIYLENADQKKYGTVLKNLNSQKSLGNDQYPKKLIEATNVLSNHWYDSTKSRTNSQRSRSHNNSNNEKEQEADEAPMLPCCCLSMSLLISFHFVHGPSFSWAIFIWAFGRLVPCLTTAIAFPFHLME